MILFIDEYSCSELFSNLQKLYTKNSNLQKLYTNYIFWY